MDTHYAPAHRAGPEALERDVAALMGHPVLTTLLGTVGGLLAVLNEHRQILALNEAYLAYLGLDAPAALLGMRPGEAARCVHAREMPGGCGTAQACATCGAAIAMVTSLGTDAASEGTCALQVQRDGGLLDLYLKVRAMPFDLEGRRLLLLFLEDITAEQRRATLERVFFHDVNNLIGALLGNGEFMDSGPEASRPECARQMQQLARRLASEVEIQRTFAQSGALDVRSAARAVEPAQLLQELSAAFAPRGAARGVSLRCEVQEGLRLHTDPALVARVLSNMVTNALEASSAGETVRLSGAREDGAVALSVWNPAAIPPAVAPRIFQRNFSTKGDLGRGLGTYSMKLFGEQVLGGRVAFTSSPEAGTTFTLRLPA